MQPLLPLALLIAHTRHSEQLSVRAFAAALRVAPADVRAWEAGTRAPTATQVALWIHAERAWVRRLSWRIFLSLAQAEGVLGELLHEANTLAAPVPAQRPQRRALKALRRDADRGV